MTEPYVQICVSRHKLPSFVCLLILTFGFFSPYMWEPKWPREMFMRAQTYCMFTAEFIFRLSTLFSHDVALRLPLGCPKICTLLLLLLQTNDFWTAGLQLPLIFCVNLKQENKFGTTNNLVCWWRLRENAGHDVVVLSDRMGGSQQWASDRLRPP